MGSQGGSRGNLPPLQPVSLSMSMNYKEWLDQKNHQINGINRHHQRSVSAGYLQQRCSDDSNSGQSRKRRAGHRRSASDSVAFMDTTDGEPDADVYDLDRFDEEQLMSIFAEIEPFQEAQGHNGVASLSDQNSGMNMNNETAMDDSSKLSNGANVNNANGNGNGRSEQEVQSTRNAESVRTEAAPATADSIMDPKRIKRIIANRQSAQRSRIRKLLYISELERSVSALQAEVATISPQVAFLDHQRTVLNMDNSALKERIAALERDKVFKDAHSEALKKELQRLRKLYQQQQQMHCKQQGTEPELSSNPAFDLQQH